MLTASTARAAVPILRECSGDAKNELSASKVRRIAPRPRPGPRGWRSRPHWRTVRRQDKIGDVGASDDDTLGLMRQENKETFRAPEVIWSRRSFGVNLEVSWGQIVFGMILISRVGVRKFRAGLIESGAGSERRRVFRMLLTRPFCTAGSRR